ncbi:MAG: ATP-dependent endonuclease [Thermoguttaceae bacterium]
MIIKEVSVKNFRSIKDASLPCEELTVLVGPNGAGKSSFLKAVELFYSAAPKFAIEDFYDSDTTADIEIAITFTALTPDEAELFANYLEGPELTVVRVLSLSSGKAAKYHGSALQNPDFLPIREAGSAKEKRTAYEALRGGGKYASLPKWTNQGDAVQILKRWEVANPAGCVRQRDDGQFFGFTEVAQGYLGRSTRFIFIPAVRDAGDDAAEGRGSPITEILDLVVRSALASRADLAKFKEEMQKQYEDILDPAKLTELGTLEKGLSSTLKSFVPDAEVTLKWAKLGDLEVPLPKADVRLVEDGYPSCVTRTGHGLQRAFILTMLQHLAVAQASSAPAAPEDGEEPPPVTLLNLVLGIEEPELYQHPNRQRHLARILAQLASGSLPGVAASTQVLYCTHAPLFVGIDRFYQVRLLRKEEATANKPRVTRVVRADGDAVAEDIWKASDGKDQDGKPVGKFSWATLRPRLQAIMTPWTSEGFFADVAVLVEGEGDRAVILGAANTMGHDLESSGISVIPCGGKSNLDRPATIFRHLGIRVYVVWDGDEGGKDSKPEDNRRLLRLLKMPVVDWPCAVDDSYACFKANLESTLKEEIGAAEFEAFLAESQSAHAIPKRQHAIKNPVVISEVLSKATTAGKSSPTMQAIITRVVALKQKVAIA